MSRRVSEATKRQLGAHGGFGGEAGRTVQDREGGADSGGDVLLEQRVGVERGGVEALRSSPQPSRSRSRRGAAVRFAQCRSEWAAVRRAAAGAGIPRNSGIARSMYCCRKATRSVLTAATFSTVPARSSHQESGS